MTTSVKDVYDMELQAFQVCNTDGEEGLTWLEVEACEVLYFLNHYSPLNKKPPLIVSPESLLSKVVLKLPYWPIG